MKQIENIADYTAELFIKKHFSNLSENDQMVKIMRNSIKDSVRHAMSVYSGGNRHKR
ncbi:MAG: hypothetical protein Kow00127_20730 [Bacteroidales bacterium]